MPAVKRVHRLLLVTLAVSAGLTVLFATVPALSFSYRSPDAYVVIETTSTLVAVLVGFLLYGRLRDTARKSDLLLLVALGLVALTNLGRTVAPAFDGANNEEIWGPQSARLIAAAMLAAAAVAPDAPLVHPNRRFAYVWLWSAGVAATVAIITLTSTGLSTGIDPTFSPADAKHSLFHDSGLLLAVEFACMLLFLIAALGFARRAERTDDQLFAWLAIGTGLAAVARFNWILFPSVYSNWLFIGDFFRLAAYLAILIGGLGEITRSQRAAAGAAVLDERQRIARDLHDRLAQDLAFISREGMRLAEGDERAAVLASSARDALRMSREAINNLRSSDAPLNVAIANLAEALVGRHGVRLRMELDKEAHAEAQTRDDLLCIVAESISNAVRHGDPTEIRIRLEAHEPEGLALTIADDGHGFEAQASWVSKNGFGLESMRTRVERLGGQFRLRSQLGYGTTVEVALP
jgi:signal transduction histidine kinase